MQNNAKITEKKQQENFQFEFTCFSANFLLAALFGDNFCFVLEVFCIFVPFSSLSLFGFACYFSLYATMMFFFIVRHFYSSFFRVKLLNICNRN